MGRIGKLLLSLVVGGAFLVLAFRNVHHDQLRDAFAQLDARWLLPAVGLSLLLQVFRAWRWQLELRPLARVPFTTLWVVVSVAYMAINLLPIRVGEVVRPWLLSRRSTVSFSTERRGEPAGDRRVTAGDCGEPAALTSSCGRPRDPSRGARRRGSFG